MTTLKDSPSERIGVERRAEAVDPHDISPEIGEHHCWRASVYRPREMRNQPAHCRSTVQERVQRTEKERTGGVERAAVRGNVARGGAG